MLGLMRLAVEKLQGSVAGTNLPRSAELKVSSNLRGLSGVLETHDSVLLRPLYLLSSLFLTFSDLRGVVLSRDH